MDVVFKSIYARACMGAGLAVLTGLRAFLPIAFLTLYSHLEFASAPRLSDTPFAVMEKWWIIGLLMGLAVVEMVLDKVFVGSSTQAQVMQPVRILLGGVVFAAAMAPEGWIAMVVAGVLGLVIAGLADHVWRTTQTRTGSKTTQVLISFYADIVVLIGTLLFVLVPLVGALLACFLVLLVYRVQVVRRRKHRGLRILRG